MSDMSTRPTYEMSQRVSGNKSRRKSPNRLSQEIDENWKGCLELQIALAVIQETDHAGSDAPLFWSFKGSSVTPNIGHVIACKAPLRAAAVNHSSQTTAQHEAVRVRVWRAALIGL
jgi:hypothetical protein